MKSTQFCGAARKREREEEEEEEEEDDDEERVMAPVAPVTRTRTHTPRRRPRVVKTEAHVGEGAEGRRVVVPRRDQAARRGASLTLQE